MTTVASVSPKGRQIGSQPQQSLLWRALQTRVTHGGNVDATTRDIDNDDLRTYAHQVFDLETVREYKQAQAQHMRDGDMG